MPKYLYKLFILLCFIGCKESYNDEELWNDADQIDNELEVLQKRINTINEQMAFLEQIANKSVITGIEKDADNHYIVSYKDADNVEKTITIATKNDVLKDAVIGIKEENGVWYWTQTIKSVTSFIKNVDGAKIPVEDQVPTLSVDNAGYLLINGVQVKDASGKAVKTELKESSLITGVSQKENTVEFTLGDGTIFTASMFNAFNIQFDVQMKTVVSDASKPFVINYQLMGEKGDKTIIDISATGCTAVLDQTAKTITVTFTDSFEKASLMIMLYDLNENFLVKPLYFVSATSTVTVCAFIMQQPESLPIMNQRIITA